MLWVWVSLSERTPRCRLSTLIERAHIFDIERLLLVPRHVGVQGRDGVCTGSLMTRRIFTGEVKVYCVQVTNTSHASTNF